MERVAALVEGQTEAYFIEEAFPSSRVFRPFPNGRDVGLDMIAECINEALQILAGDFRYVVILLDKERRRETSSEIREYLRERILKSHRSLSIGVADIQIETWILADEIKMRSQSGQAAYNYGGDGCSAKRILRDLLGASLAPRDKARLLKACSAARGAKVSRSLAEFREEIDFDWWWMVA